jgi:hypothetical protein
MARQEREMKNRLMVQEGQLLAVFNSAHKVMKAESILKALGVPILLIPAPRQLQTDCGLALRFAGDDEGRIMEVLGAERLLPAFVSVCRGGAFVTTWTNSETDTHAMGGDD